ncbi:MAG: transcriptional repressor LexA [Ruminococcus sp.]|nr:transcriptional repressor LexA [Ruminococcus sp.]MBQ3855658.1 transcriptional repressor LexA [Ruminococcus sp.]MBQ8122927.1 transcriptional repressor LexA [Ruminococcus sp.]HBB20741.1 transcriptional repressor LexA [Ruminococcus sp.]HOO06096.1 transcriptional repressor LexA [Ruminococcus sp.]
MLKDKEIEVFNYIKSRLSEGISPSVREIMDAMGFRSTSTAHRYIEALVKEGLIEKSGNLNRSLRLPNSASASVPILGTVTAGQPITAIQDITGYLGFEAPGKDPEDLFALRVRGESMINVGILDGDIVIVERVPYAENNDIVVALVDGEEATVKRFFKEKGHYRLQPENDTMEPIIVEDCQVLGKVIGLKRYY